MSTIKSKLAHRDYSSRITYLSYFVVLLVYGVLFSTNYIKGGMSFTYLRLGDGLNAIFGATDLTKLLISVCLFLFIAPTVFTFIPNYLVRDAIKTGKPKDRLLASNIHIILWSIQFTGYMICNFIFYVAECAKPMKTHDTLVNYVSYSQAFILMYCLFGLLLLVNTYKMLKDIKTGIYISNTSIEVIEIPDVPDVSIYTFSDLAEKLSALKRALNKDILIVHKHVGINGRVYSGEYINCSYNQELSMALIEATQSERDGYSKMKVPEFVRFLRSNGDIDDKLFFTVENSGIDAGATVTILQNHAHVIIYIQTL